MARHSALGPCPRRAKPEIDALLTLLAAVDELTSCLSPDGLLARAVQIARTRLGLERLSFHLLDVGRERIALLGSQGTGRRGEMTDERGCDHEVSREDLARLEAAGSCGLYLDRVSLFAGARGHRVQIAVGWSVVTPLTASKGLLGVMYNDCALSGSPLDLDTQARAALFCRMVGAALAAARAAECTQPALPASPQNSITRRAIEVFRTDPLVSAEQVARRLSVSPRFLARSFKQELGVTVVQYRNRLRMQRFLACAARPQSTILDAALEAGFGSYSQFHRVHRQLMGTAPRDHVAHLRADGHASTGDEWLGFLPGFPAHQVSKAR